MFLVLLRPIFCEKLKIAPHTKTAPPQTSEFAKLDEKSVSVSVKTFFFLEISLFWAEKTFEFPSFPRNFVSIFGQTVWNWFKDNENSGQGRLHFSHSIKIAPPPPFPNPDYAPAPNWITTNDKYNESVVSMLSLSGVAVSLIQDLRIQK